jgi:large repetitive protein
MFSRFKTINAITASILILFLASCSTKKNLDGTPVEDGPVTSVTVSADKTTTVSGGKVNLTAKVEGSGSYNKTVTWKILSGSGRIKGEDTSAVYTADLAVDKGGPVLIEATARGDETKKATVGFVVEATTSVVVNVHSWDHASKIAFVNSPNVPVKLYNAAKQIVQEGVTDSNGNIEFLGLTPQEYTLTEDIPDGYGVISGGSDVYGFVGGRRIITRRLPLTTGPVYLATYFRNTLAVVVGQVYVDRDFSEVREAKLKGTTSVDRDKLGQIIYSEPGVAQTTLTLTGTDLNGSPVKRSVNPAGDGRFEIPGVLAGKYTLTQTQSAELADWNEHIVTGLERLIYTTPPYIERTSQLPLTSAGQPISFQHNSTDRTDSTSEFVISEGQSVGGFMFAESDLPVTGRVYIDRDRDGERIYPDERNLVEDPNPIPNVVLKISGNSQNEVATSTKDGTFFFDRAVPSGTYKLSEVNPLGYGVGHAHIIGTASHFEFPPILGDDASVVVPQRESSGVDTETLLIAKPLPPVTVETTVKPVEFGDEVSNIMGSVFQDDNGNGIRDLGDINVDPGLVLNVPMRLTGTDIVSNNINITVSLDRLGYFVFPDLLQGTYKIEQVEQPQNYQDGKTRPGVINGIQVGNGGISNVISGIVLPAGSDAGGLSPVFSQDLRILYRLFKTDGYTFGELANPPKP